MKYTVVYESELSNSVSIPFIVITILFVVMMVWGIFLTKSNQGNLKSGIGPFVIAFVLFVIIVVCVVNYISSYTNIWKKYDSQETMVVEGIVENYEIIKGRDETDTFTVNDVVFNIPNYASEYGYTLRQKDGSILEDGVMVRITYIEYKTENIIMKLEMLQ